MDTYTQAVALIVNDYLDRLKAQLRMAPARERDEVLREIESHIYEAYHQTSTNDEVARILTVLRKLGEPAQVAADRLPETMVRSGTSRSVPLHVLTGILIALFGIPLGVGGVAAFVGVFVALGAIVAAYYAAMGALFVVAAGFVCVGLVRMYNAAFWDRLIKAGVIQLDWKIEQILSGFSPQGQGVLLIAFGAIALAGALAMLFGGQYLIRGLRFLYSVGFDWLRKVAEAGRRTWRSFSAEGFALPRFSVAK